MESLFQLTELESRIPLNMNVLVQGPRAEGDGPCRGADASGSTIAARCWCGAPSYRLAQDRAPARGARRLSRRLSQPRQGHQDHPQRGRAEARPDEDLQAHRRAGRRHPQHAAAQLAQARGDGDPQRGQGAARRAQGAQGAARLREGAVEDGRRRDQGGARRRSARRRRSASAAPTFAEAPEHDEAAIEEAMVEREPITVVVSEKGWIRALRGHRRPISPASRSRPTTG